MKPAVYLSAYLIVAAVFAASMRADSAMNSPAIGYIRDARGTWHSVSGVSGSFTLGPAEAEPAPPSIIASRYSVEKREGTFYILNADGSTADILPPDARGPVFVSASTVLYATSDQLVVRSSQAPDIRLDCAGITALRAMSDEWIQVSTASHDYALRLTSGHEALYLLPAAPPDPESGAHRR